MLLKEEAEDHHGKAVVLDALGQVALLEGHLEFAATRFREALALQEKAGDIAGATQTQVNLAQALVASTPAPAAELLRTAIRACRTRRQLATKIEAYLALASLLFSTHDRPGAGRAAMMAAKLADKAGSQLLSLRSRLIRAEIDLSYRGPERATRAAELALNAAQTTRELGAVRWRIEALSLAAVAHHRLGVADAQSEAQEALQLLKERGSVGLRPEVIEGRCQEALGAPHQIHGSSSVNGQ